MQAFHSLFHAKPSLGTLSAELNAQIITVRPDGGGDGSAGVQGAYRVSLSGLTGLTQWRRLVQK